MDSQTNAVRKVEMRPNGAPWKPIGGVSREVTRAIDAVADYSLREPDPTLEELRMALQGTALTWTRNGKLTFAPERMALVSEIDELIQTFGANARAADLFPGTFAKNCQEKVYVQTGGSGADRDGSLGHRPAMCHLLQRWETCG